MTKPIRWGILGAAKIAKTALAPAISLANNSVLAALATRNHASAADFVMQYPNLKIHQGYEALLGDPDIDAVYIPLPNHLHIEWSRKCLLAGKHVLCEKSIALKAGEIDELMELRDKTGLLAAEAVMVVHHPQWHRVRQLIADGAIGALRQVDGVFTYNNSADVKNVRNQQGMGGGAMLDIGIYPTVTTRFATGAEPHTVKARMEFDGEVDTSARVTAQFEGFDLDFYCSMRMGLRQEMVFHGEAGWIKLHAPFNAGDYGEAILELRRSDLSSTVERFTTADQYKLQIEAFNQAVQGGDAFPMPLEFSRGTQAVIDAAFASAQG